MENKIESITEDQHWWFASRTRAILTMFDAQRPGRDLKLLDVGCGAGNMIHHLSRYGQVQGVEIDPRPVAVAQRRGYAVEQGDAVEGLRFDDGAFDVVSALDVIEHNEDDMAILREAHRVLKPGGHVIITVPALMWLWSHNDEINAHVRRYTAKALRQKLEQAGFGIRRITYNNFFVFPMAAGLIMMRKLSHSDPELASHHLSEEEYQVEMEPAPGPVNAVLTVVGGVEAQVLRWFSLPIGTGLLAIAQK
jgi:SAM-dependent methyltransferase